ncbi:DEAD/DEAH box helicase [Blattabacterium cuenoti]|uniref:DEAD/DEAH box helicase n=1 Tax=Blattabacterium cuenoti TaxID=1653831 RepID=UPI00163C7781|nr:DEAD/DEAH box helicase [Blattabacterium cuenoti]
MKTFKEYNFFNNKIITALEEIKFKNPTPIQKKVIPFLLKNKKDLIALAQTGTGKTAAFSLPIIQQLNLNDSFPQAIILCPTRELCIQITHDLIRFSKYISLKIIPLYGGVSIDNQIKYLNKKNHIIVGTPGRILDLIKRKRLNLSNIKYLVLDEADEMLNMGFKEELDAIIDKLPKNRQSLLFSATMSKYINLIAHNYLIDPMEIVIGKKNIGSNDVKHIYYIVNNKNKYLALKRIVDINPEIYGIIFCKTRKETRIIAESLIQDGYNADALYGDLSQKQRESVMNRFKTKILQFLVATDIAARGIDVNDITHVINYNLPYESKIYVHRSGRTGRAGNTGISICIIHYNETYFLKEFEKKIGKSFEQIQIPSGKEICEKQLLHFIKKIKKVIVNDKYMNDYLPQIQQELELFNKKELIKRFSFIEFNRYLSSYKDSKNLNIFYSKNFNKKSFYSKNSNKKSFYSKLFINIGYKDNLTKLKLIHLINQSIKNSRINIGNIEILSNFSLFEIEKRYQKKILIGMSKINHFRKPITIEIKN